jgi:hypothetical protein
MGTPRYVELRSYLEGFGINANRVQAEGMDETGYDYVQEYRDGRPMYKPGGGFQLQTERVEWPSLEVWEKVLALYTGTPTTDVAVEVKPRKALPEAKVNLKGPDPEIVAKVKAAAKDDK